MPQAGGGDGASSNGTSGVPRQTGTGAIEHDESVLPAEEMPDDNADLAVVAVDFERLADDDPTSCPVSLGELLEYLAMEVPDGEALTESSLRFLRTAEVGGTQYWIWSFEEPEGAKAYATVSVSPEGSATLGYDADYYGLSPEQFILGDYHQVF